MMNTFCHEPRNTILFFKFLKQIICLKKFGSPDCRSFYPRYPRIAGFTLSKAIACAVEFDNQHCGIYAGDWDSYKVRPSTIFLSTFLRH